MWKRSSVSLFLCCFFFYSSSQTRFLRSSKILYDLSYFWTLRSTDLYNSNGHRNTPIPLEVIYEEKTIPKPSNKGHLNPEFIGEDDDDNDIYKAQLLLFLKQSHLIRPNVYPDEQDNNSDTSDYSRKNSRRVSALSAASEKNQGDQDKPDVKIETAVS